MIRASAGAGAAAGVLGANDPYKSLKTALQSEIDEDAWATLTAHVPALHDMWLRFSSLPVRNAGTLGGSIANGSPIGDSAPVLMALGTDVVLRRGDATRSLRMEDFYLDYMKNAMEPGEFIEALDVTLPSATQQVRAYKLSKRFDCDISAVAAGLVIELDGELVRTARFAFGGMAATVKRAAGAEAAIVGQPWTEATVEAAMAAQAAASSSTASTRSLITVFATPFCRNS